MRYAGLQGKCAVSVATGKHAVSDTPVCRESVQLRESRSSHVLQGHRGTLIVRGRAPIQGDTKPALTRGLVGLRVLILVPEV